MTPTEIRLAVYALALTTAGTALLAVAHHLQHLKGEK